MWLSKLNHRHVPARAIALQAGIAALIAITFTFEHLLLYIDSPSIFFAALTVLSLFKLRREGRSKVKICIGYPITPLIFLRIHNLDDGLEY